MISSSEVGGCCRVQVAWLPPRCRPLLLHLFFLLLSLLLSSSSSSFLPPFRVSPLAPVLSLSLTLPLSRSLYRTLQPPSCSRAILPTSKNSDHPTTAATHARRGLRACKVVLPSNPGVVAARNVSTIYGAIAGVARYMRSSRRAFLLRREYRVSSIEILPRPRTRGGSVSPVSVSCADSIRFGSAYRRVSPETRQVSRVHFTLLLHRVSMREVRLSRPTFRRRSLRESHSCFRSARCSFRRTAYETHTHACQVSRTDRLRKRKLYFH